MDRKRIVDELWQSRFDAMGLAECFEFIRRDWTSDHGRKVYIRCKRCGTTFTTWGLSQIFKGRQLHLLCIKCGAASDGDQVIVRSKLFENGFDSTLACEIVRKEKQRNRSRTERFRSSVVDSGITIDKLISRDGPDCYICGKKTTFSDTRWGKWGPDYPSIDHVIPLSRGGKHSWENVRLCCGGCNAAKGKRLPGGLT